MMNYSSGYCFLKMNLFTKNLFTSQGLKRCSYLSHLPNHLRLTCAHHYSLGFNNSSHSKPGILAPTHCMERQTFFLPERRVMTAYFREVVKSKIADAYDSIRHFGRAEEKFLGAKWYATLDEVNHNEFIKLLDLSDTFYSWFKIIELHTWMLLLSLPANTRSHRAVRIGVINTMWVDTEKRGRLIAPDNKNFKKNMKSLYLRFQVSLFLYDEGYFNTDRELCSAMWYNFFDKENVDPRLLEVLVSYIRYQINHLSNLQLLPMKVEDKNLKFWTPLKTHYEKVFNKL